MNFLKTAYDSEPEDSLEKSISLVASAISDPSRVSILCALMDGRAWTATEFSAVAGIVASTTSGHLTRLLNNGLVICLSQGRHRYYSLAGQHIAELLENLMGVSMHTFTSPTPRTPAYLRYARTCYDHLAGELAVNIYEFMLQEKWLEADGTALTPAGKSHFQHLGAVLTPRPRRRACCPCLDWSERRFHLGGEAGSALMTLFLQKEWITRTQGYREVKVTISGRVALCRQFSLNLA
ncbi:helix-turn-helix transcriptional regulator [Enterobacter sp. R1(2018)]|uniref:ArsR/SmtB family transcription factor n=1 Tax=Enterobacter sp. R1(2018) TaxID=2447891 RepID=UPI000EB3E5B7|nr:helix-turn-helix transcriptional regulator [Enterobacter sp. R1(2018)]RKQ39134.1 transcriptional regulator [Enterobacter sp. R1(2018)]